MKLDRQAQLFWLILLIGVVVRVFELHGPSLWNDEGYSYILSRVSRQELRYAIAHYDAHPPVWYWICKVPLTFFPYQPWLVRLPAAGASFLSIWFLYGWIRRHFQQRAALMASALLAVSPLSVFYAQEGRNYALLALLYLVAIGLCHDYCIRRSKTTLLLMSVVVIASLYLHDIAVALWLGLNGYYLAFFWLHRPAQPWPALRGWILAQLAITVSLLAYLPLVLDHIGLIRAGDFSYGWFWEKNFWFKGVLHSLRNLIPGDFTRKSHMPIPYLPDFSWILSILTVVLFITSRVWRHVSTFLPLLIGILLPLFCISLFSDWIAPAYWIGRTESLVLPVFCAVMGLLIDRTKPPRLGLGFLTIFLFAGLASLGFYFFSQEYPRKTWDAITAKSILFQTRPDIVVMEKDVRASVAAHLMASLVTHPEVRVTPYPNLDLLSSASWPAELLALQNKKDLQPDSYGKGIDRVERMMTSYPQGAALTVVYAGMEESGQVKPSVGMDAFLTGMRHRGCQQATHQGIYPMDWHHKGYHVVLRLQCPPL